MNKDTWIGIAAIVIILGGIVAYANFAPRHAAPSTTSTSTDAVITDNQQYYTIEAHYPTTTSLATSAGASADQAAVALMAADVQSTVESFKTESGVASITPADAATMGLGADRKYALDVEYIATSSPSVASYIFTIYYDTLGAHPNGTYLTENFDAKTGTRIAITDLFNSGTDVYTELSQLARAQLPAIIAAQEGTTPDQIDPSMMNDGTTAAAQNFQWFYVANGDLVLIFPPYQVGPYALGTVLLPIPLSSLPNVKPAYQ